VGQNCEHPAAATRVLSVTELSPKSLINLHNLRGTYGAKELPIMPILVGLFNSNPKSQIPISKQISNLKFQISKPLL